ncbi:MAG: secretin N-terminal domain-containing protein [Phycisphaerae bacterium]
MRSSIAVMHVRWVRVLGGLLVLGGLAGFAAALRADPSASHAEPEPTTKKADTPSLDEAEVERELLELKKLAQASIDKKAASSTQPASTTQRAVKKPARLKGGVKPFQLKNPPKLPAVPAQRKRPRSPKIRPKTPKPAGRLPGAEPKTAPPGSGKLPAPPAATAADAKKPPVDQAAKDAEAYAGATPAPVTNTKTKVLVFDMETVKPEERTYRFDYVNTPWKDVIQDFSRVSGLRIVNLPTDDIPGQLSYHSEKEMTFIEALHTLNDLLFKQPFNSYVIQRQDNYLTVGRLADLTQEIPPERMYHTFEEFEAANLDPYDICLTNIAPPPGWSPYQIIEKYREYRSDTYGAKVNGDLIELSGLAREHHLFKKVIMKLATREEPPPVDPRPKIQVPLKAAKASDVAQLLKQLYPVAPALSGRRGRGAQVVDRALDKAKRLTIIPDIKNNVIYARGPRDLLDQIKETIANVDVGEWRPPQQEMVQLENAAANTVVAALKPLFQREAANMVKSLFWIPPAMKDALRVDLFGNASSNTVILIGGAEGIARAKRLVQQYDVPPDWVNEVIELKHADAIELAATIQASLPAPSGKGVPQPRIVPRSARRILVSCNKQDHQRVLELVAKLDVADEDKPAEHFVQLEHARPTDVAQSLQQMMQGTSKAPARPVRQVRGRKGRRVIRPVTQRPGASASGPIYVPDDAAKTLIVVCSERDWIEVEPLIQRLEELAGKVVPKLLTIALEKANAADVANAVNQMFPPPADRRNWSRRTRTTIR